MNPEEYIQQEQLNIARRQASQGDAQKDYQAMQLQNEETNIIREQLSLTPELIVMKNLLQSKELTLMENGTEHWLLPEDEDQIILTNHGVNLIYNTLVFYMNKNTLLSNYTDMEILEKMQDFATTLNDDIFMEYEKVFSYPTFERCKKVLIDRLESKAQRRQFAFELLGIKKGITELKKEFVTEIEDRVEKELEKIKEQIIKNKLKRFELIIRKVQDAVHSTYKRAWNGQERRTLRQHIHINETMGGTIPQQKPPRIWNPFGRKH